MNMDLDDEELRATRKLLGLNIKEGIEEDIKTLEEFIKIYEETQKRYKDDEIQAEIEKSCYFEEIPYKEMKNLLQDYKRQKQINEEHRKINGELREKVKELKEENKELMSEYHNRMQEKIELEQDLKILEQKIKDEIEELKNENYQISLGSNVILDSEIMKNNLKIQTLQELLKEREE